MVATAPSGGSPTEPQMVATQRARQMPPQIPFQTPHTMTAHASAPSGHRFNYHQHNGYLPALQRQPTLGARFASTDIRLELASNMTDPFTQQPRQPYSNQGYLPNGASNIQPAPGATPLLPNQGRVLQTGPIRVLCIADVRGKSQRLNCI